MEKRTQSLVGFLVLVLMVALKPAGGHAKHESTSWLSLSAVAVVLIPYKPSAAAGPNHLHFLNPSHHNSTFSLLLGIPPSLFHLDTRLTLQTLSWGLLSVVVPNAVVNTLLCLPIAHLLHNPYHAVLNYTEFFCFHPGCTESPKRIVVSQVLGLYI